MRCDELRNVDGLKQAIDHFGRMPTVREYNEFAREHGFPHSTVLMRRIKMNWAEIRAALKLQSLDKLKPEFLIAKLQEAAKILGKDFSLYQYRELRKKRDGFPPPGTIENVFGSWNEAKIAAGLPISQRQTSGKVYTKEDCKRALQEYMKETGNKRIVLVEYDAWRQKKWDDERLQYPSGAIIRRRFGFLVTAAAEAGGHYFAHVDEEIAFNSFLEYVHQVVNFRAYDEWAVKNGKYTHSYFIGLGVNIQDVFKKAVDVHFDKEFRSISRHGVKTKKEAPSS